MKSKNFYISASLLFKKPTAKYFTLSTFSKYINFYLENVKIFNNEGINIRNGLSFTSKSKIVLKKIFMVSIFG